ENTRSPWTFIVTYNNSSIFIKTDIGSIFTSCANFRTNDDSFNNLAFFDNAAWCCFLYGTDYDVADIRSVRSEEHTSELQSRFDLVCRLLLEKKKKNKSIHTIHKNV